MKTMKNNKITEEVGMTTSIVTGGNTDINTNGILGPGNFQLPGKRRRPKISKRAALESSYKNICEDIKKKIIK